MSIQPAESPASTGTATHLRHIYCMAHGIPEHGLCGTTRNVPVGVMGPISGVYAPPNMCVVCADLMFAPCADCADD